VKEFLGTLAVAGYEEKTQLDKRRMIGSFIRWADAARLGVAELDDARVEEFLVRPSRRRRKRGNHERTAVQQFLVHLRSVGVVPLCRSPRPSPSELLIEKYLDHLRSDRGLRPRSVEVYLPFVRAFVTAQRLPERAEALDASSIRTYLLDHCRRRSVSFVKLMTAALRSFLRFFFFDGATTMDLSTAVPPVRRWQFASIPQLLTSEEMERVLAATDRSTARGMRAHAMLLLLARLGMRAGEVAALKLEDIRWDVGEIVVRSKGRREDRLPLLNDVGRALAIYLRKARGPSTSRRLFLRLMAPHVGLLGPTAVCLVARQAVRRAGLLPTGRVGAHVFRHGLATRMIRHGASLAEISQVLRHRSIDSTQLYAKVEFEALRGVALPWPKMEARR
jgi:site-specific recombinase XerD